MSNIPGMSTVGTYEPTEIRAFDGDFIAQPVTIEAPENLAIGTIIGAKPATGKYGAYDADGSASATTPAAGADNQGANTIASVAVDNNKTLTEDWTLTCTDDSTGGSEVFSVVGSVSGDVGDATVGVEFTDATTGITFTIADPGANAVEDDVFTFSTVACPALEADGILSEAVDASDADQLSTMYVKGSFVYADLVGIDSDAIEAMNGKVVEGVLYI